MPIMGLGTYSLDYDTCVASVTALLDNGGRLVDTAYMYHNEDALAKIGLEYIDLMLLHHPGTNDVEAFLPQATIMPAVVQNEIHPYYQEIDVVPYIQELGIIVEGWYPFGGRGYTKEILENETISAIAAAHDVTSAQVILRWNLQRGVAVIPGSGNPEHIAENLDIFGFELTEDEMEQIKSLNRDEKHDWY